MLISATVYIFKKVPFRDLGVVNVLHIMLEFLNVDIGVAHCGDYVTKETKQFTNNILHKHYVPTGFYWLLKTELGSRNGRLRHYHSYEDNALTSLSL